MLVNMECNFLGLYVFGKISFIERKTPIQDLRGMPLKKHDHKEPDIYILGQGAN